VTLSECRQIGRDEAMRIEAGIPSTDREARAIVGSTRTLLRMEKGERTKLTWPAIGALCDYYGGPAEKQFELQRRWRFVDETVWAQPSHAVVTTFRFSTWDSSAEDP